MNAHIELDFNDDGTVTLTLRRTKGGEFEKEVVNGADTGYIKVAGGSDDTVTNLILITGRGKATDILREQLAAQDIKTEAQ